MFDAHHHLLEYMFCCTMATTITNGLEHISPSCEVEEMINKVRIEYGLQTKPQTPRKPEREVSNHRNYQHNHTRFVENGLMGFTDVDEEPNNKLYDPMSRTKGGVINDHKKPRIYIGGNLFRSNPLLGEEAAETQGSILAKCQTLAGDYSNQTRITCYEENLPPAVRYRIASMEHLKERRDKLRTQMSAEKQNLQQNPKVVYYPISFYRR